MIKEEQLKIIEEIAPLIENRQGYRKVRHKFFSNIKTELQAYLLGFYAADGNIQYERAKFRITLNIVDADSVNLFRDILCPTAKTSIIGEKQMINTRNNKEYTIKPSYSLEICSRKICNDLTNYGMGEQKTYKNLEIPKMPENLIKHFIRGYFDGDGCITGWLAKDSGRIRFRRSFDICGKTNSILIEFINFFKSNDIKINLNYLKRDDMYRIKTSSKKELIKIFHLLYDDANYYMSRKYEKFNHYVNTEDLQLIAEACNAQEVNVNESNNLPKSSEHLNSCEKDENVR